MVKRTRGKRADRAKEEAKIRRKRKESMVSLAKDVLVAVVIVILVMASLYAYSGGIWPPMVVVESESMMHGDDSEIGIIDTGDLTLVKRISSRDDIVTWVEGNPEFKASWDDEGGFQPEEKFKGKMADFRTYGDYGEVIIYRKNGQSTEVSTPVIHRAIVWIEPNTEPDCLSSLPMDKVAAANFPDIKNKDHPEGLKCVYTLKLKNVGYLKEEVVIDVNHVLGNAIRHKGEAFSGFLTKGDHNRGGSVDQTILDGGSLAPVKADWVVGEAVGELPWFGALKLVFSGTIPSEKIPPSSWNGLIVTIILIVVIPFILDIISNRMAKKKRSKKEKEKAEQDEEEEEGTEEESEEEPSKDEPLDEEEEPDLNDEFRDEFEDMKK